MLDFLRTCLVKMRLSTTLSNCTWGTRTEWPWLKQAVHQPPSVSNSIRAEWKTTESAHTTGVLQNMQQENETLWERETHTHTRTHTNICTKRKNGHVGRCHHLVLPQLKPQSVQLWLMIMAWRLPSTAHSTTKRVPHSIKQKIYFLKKEEKHG